MKIKDLIQELRVIERDYGNLSLNRGAEDIRLEICDDTLMIMCLSDL